VFENTFLCFSNFDDDNHHHHDDHHDDDDDGDELIVDVR